jgi:hypothetical protein
LGKQNLAVPDPHQPAATLPIPIHSLHILAAIRVLPFPRKSVLEQTRHLNHHRARWKEIQPLISQNPIVLKAPRTTTMMMKKRIKALERNLERHETKTKTAIRVRRMQNPRSQNKNVRATTA